MTPTHRKWAGVTALEWGKHYLLERIEAPALLRNSGGFGAEVLDGLE